MKKKRFQKIFLGLLIAAGVLLIAGCSSAKAPEANTLNAPSYSRNAGTYSEEQQITINPPEGQDIKVYYTLDGSDPTDQSSKYEAPITIQTTATLKSIAKDKNGNTSDIKSTEYIITTSAPTVQAKKEMTEDEELEAFKKNVQGKWSKKGKDTVISIHDGKMQFGSSLGGGLSQRMITYKVEPGSNGEKGYLTSSDGTSYVNCSPMGDGQIELGDETCFYLNDEPIKAGMPDEDIRF